MQKNIYMKRSCEKYFGEQNTVEVRYVEVLRANYVNENHI